MAQITLMKDNPLTRMREAWQNQRIVFSWPRTEIDAMHKEAPQAVPAWGCYPNEKPVWAKDAKRLQT